MSCIVVTFYDVIDILLLFRDADRILFLVVSACLWYVYIQAEDGRRVLVRSRWLGDVYKRQGYVLSEDGTPLILIDARKWWEEEVQFQDWSVP